MKTRAGRLAISCALGVSAVVSLYVDRSCWAAERPNYDAHTACLHHEVDVAVKKAFEKGTTGLDVQNEIGDQAFALCSSRYPWHLQSTVLSKEENVNISKRVMEIGRMGARTMAINAMTALMRADMDKKEAARREKDGPKMRAESAEASRLYRDCLLKNAREMALYSSEPAETIREATFVVCRNERVAIAEVHFHYRDKSFDERALDVADKTWAGTVLLEIIRARAAGSSSPLERTAR
jgi:hypothetical protein